MPILTNFILILFLGFGFRTSMSQLIQQFDIFSNFQLPALGLNGIAFVLLSAFILSLIFPKRFKRPSDVFLFVYMVIVLIPKIFLLGIFQKLSPIDSVVISFLLFLPVASVWAVSRIKVLPSLLWVDKPVGQFNSGLTLGLTVSAFVIIFLQFRGGLSFDFAMHYDRRFLLRESADELGLQIYFINFFSMGLAPFVAFVAMQQKNIALWALAICSGLLIFSISGEKFPFILIAAATGLGFVMSLKRDLSISFLLFLMSGISFIAVAEIYLLGSAVWGDWIFRRFVMVPSYITEIYYHYLLAADGLTFLGLGEKKVTYLMGEIYFDNPELNLNTNFVFVELAMWGVLGLGGAILFLTFWLKIIDEAYRRTRDKRFFLLVLLIATIAFEQRIYSVFLSSGIGVLSVIVFINAVWKPKIFSLQKILRSN